MNLNEPFMLRNLVYGTEDSLISTTGLVVGIAASGAGRREILVTGGILLLVEALSMSFGSFVSEDAFMNASKLRHATSDVLKYAGVMFASYMIAGAIPLLPFAMCETPTAETIATSVALALACLYALMWKVEKSDDGSNHNKALTMTLVGAVILGVSIAVGRSVR